MKMAKITLILHNIRSTHNVGSIFRSAEGFGVTGIVLSGYTPAPKFDGDTRLPHIADKLARQIHKTALGAETIVPFEVYEKVQNWRTTHPNIPLIALEQDKASVDIRDFTPPDEFALLLGEEVEGIDRTHLANCDVILEIPMYGKKESFNVSVATGIALFALTK